VYSYDFDIRCRNLITGRVPLGRAFWASLPAMAKWRGQILDPESVGSTGK
jgi:hypothetical protein